MAFLLKIPRKRIPGPLHNTRSYTSPSQSSLSQIPESPPSPVPLVNQRDIDEFRETLQTSGWHLCQATNRFENLGYKATRWTLHHPAIFPSFKLVMQYVNGIADIAKVERHHPMILIHDRVKVDVSLDTHDTMERPAILPDGQAISGRWPGVTLRDIRMALLIDPLVRQHKGLSSPTPAISKLNSLSLDQLLTVQIQPL